MKRVNCEISQLSPLNDRWDYLTNQKRQAIDIAQKMPGRYRDRMAACSEWLKFQVFQNDHERIAKSWKCRVRGCPVCEQNLEFGNKKDLTKVLIAAKKKYPTWLCSLFTFEKVCSPDKLKSELDSSKKAIKNALKRKQFAGCEYTFKISMSFGFGSAFLQRSVLVFHPRAKFLGNNYMSKKKLQEVFCLDDTMSVDWNLEIDKSIVLPSRSLDLTIATELEIQAIVKAVHKVKLIGYSQGLRSEPAIKKPVVAPEFKPSTSYFAVFAPCPENLEDAKYSAVPEFDYEENLIEDTEWLSIEN
jgi:hypothetical protein